MTARPVAVPATGGGVPVTGGLLRIGGVTRSLRATVAPTVPARTVAGPVRSLRPDPQAWALALQLAGRDARRCIPSPDGLSVLVVNRPR